MSPFILSFADGTTFFVGLGIVLVAETLLFCFRNRRFTPVFTLATILGVILVYISATPLPTWAYIVWTIPAITLLVLLNRAVPPWRGSLIGGAVLATVTCLLWFAEAPFHRRPTLDVSSETTVYVLGDSISAGIGTKHRSWPTVLDERTALQVINLAKPGATVASAIQQAKGISEPESFVIVEIGGNDLLGTTSAQVFHNELDALLTSLRANHHDVLMLELPLFPFQNAYGKAQRETARKHEVTLLPKRYFARVLGTQDGTLDGLHLAPAGHDAMAEIIAKVLGQE